MMRSQPGPVVNVGTDERPQYMSANRKARRAALAWEKRQKRREKPTQGPPDAA